MVDNPHFTNAINWAKDGVNNINRGLAQAADEYERLEMIHKEDSDTIDRLLKQMSAANVAIRIGIEFVEALQNNKTWLPERPAYTTEQIMTLLVGIKDALNSKKETGVK